jgi:glycogen operon protein
MVSQGTPMLLYGDEVRRTQGGNNNAYCQDNETSWFNWEAVETERSLLRFVRLLIQFNRQHPVLNMDLYAADLPTGSETNRHTHGDSNGWIDEYIAYHGVQVGQPDWGHSSHSIALTLHGQDLGDDDVHLVFNAYWKDLDFELPARPREAQWLRAIDTSLAPPEDIAEPGQEHPICAKTYLVRARSVVILIGHNAH